jgi:prepilin-type N-terminal cleavage/methylation domain-containing protein
MNRNRGLTLVEILVVVSIIAIVVALVTPVFQQVRDRARVTSAVSAMHQIGKAVALYRSDWETGGGYTSFDDLGLPTHDYLWRTGLGLGTLPPASPCGYKAGIGWDNSRSAPDIVWVYVWDYALPKLTADLEKYQENTLIAFDPWCNPSGTEWANPYAEKRAIGLLLSGQVINRRRAGRADFQEWWAPPPP